jgi:hypothetical protein
MAEERGHVAEQPVNDEAGDEQEQSVATRRCHRLLSRRRKSEGSDQ